MEKLIVSFNISVGIKRHVIRRVSLAFIIGITASSIPFRPAPSRAVEPNDFAIVGHPEYALQNFGSHQAMLRGYNWTLNLGPHTMLRHESLGGGKAGDSKIRWRTTGVGPVFNGDSRCDAKIGQQDGETQDKGHAVALLSLREKVRVYIVRRGDSLWNIAKRFDMNHQTLARINGLSGNEILQYGRPLKVEGFSSRELRLNVTVRSLANHPAFLEQIRMIDGRPVPHWLVTDFLAEVTENPSAVREYRHLKNGVKNLTIVINFQLVKNLLEGRARRYKSIVAANAERYNLDPALIMAVIHTESGFNPDALSNASAYGLMQLVPHTAGQEAYYWVYGQRRQPTPQYLYDPKNNIELGTAYFHILRNGYLGSITDPISRTYCAVAAYHAGPANVGRAFISEASIKLAIPVINQLSPAEVYKRLVDSLPSIESRNYVRDVIKRMRRYRGWYSKDCGAQT